MFRSDPRSVVKPRQLALAAALLTPLLSATSALADNVNFFLSDVTPKTIEVESNGSAYTAIAGSGLGNIVADARVDLDTEVGGRIKSWSVWLLLSWPVEYPTASLSLRDFATGKSYGYWDRPKRVDLTAKILVPETAYSDWIVSQCNAMAQNLRNSGQSNKAIFSQDRNLVMAARVGSHYDATGAGSNNWIEESASPVLVNITCKKWPGMTAPVAGGGGLTTGLVSAQLTVIENYGPYGLCMLKLSGVLESGNAGTEVSYRYEDDKGHKSEVFTATTDHSKTAFFYQQYELANNPDGPENGKVRVVGVNHSFASAWKPYSMNCVEPGATGLTAQLPPALTLSAAAIPNNSVMIGGQVCPKQVRLAGKITGRGPFHGYAVFFGPSFLTPQQSYEVEHGTADWVFAIYDLKWTHDVNQLAVPDTDDEPMQQTVRFSFNVNGSETPGALITQDDPPVASISQKPFKFTCQWPKVTPGLQGGTDLTVPQPKPAGQQQSGVAANAQIAAAALPFSIQAPRGTATQGVIRLQGVADKNAKFVLSWFARKNGAYKPMSVRGLPERMIGAAARFDLRALAAASAWRLRICPQGAAGESACRQTEFKAPAEAAQ